MQISGPMLGFLESFLMKTGMSLKRSPQALEVILNAKAWRGKHYVCGGGEEGNEMRLTLLEQRIYIRNIYKTKLKKGLEVQEEDKKLVWARSDVIKAGFKKQIFNRYLGWIRIMVFKPDSA